MKFSTAAILALPAVAAFQPAFVHQSKSSSSSLTRLSVAVVTGPKGKAAASAEEDLMLTLQIIMDHQDRSTTASKEQFLSQMEEIKNAPDEEPIDVSIPYDAAARLAYEASDKKMNYDDFKAKYEADAIALVKSKQKVDKKEAPKKTEAAPKAAATISDTDVSIPYDAAAKLAYEASDKKIPYEHFKLVYENEAINLVKSKTTWNVSVPYDAAARLAYQNSDGSMSYDDFKAKYEADAIALVKSKKK
jgi:hypothetical protein